MDTNDRQVDIFITHPTGQLGSTYLARVANRSSVDACRRRDNHLRDRSEQLMRQLPRSQAEPATYGIPVGTATGSLAVNRPLAGS